MIKIFYYFFFKVVIFVKNKFPITYYKFLLLKSFVLNNIVINDFLVKKIITKTKFEKINFKKDFQNKIILVIGKLSHGGAERQVLRLAEYLIKKKYNVKIVSLVYGSKQVKYKIDKNIKIDFVQTKVNKKYYLNHFLYPTIKNLHFFSMYEKLQFLKLFDYLKKENPYCIHAFLDFYSIISGFAGIILNTPKVILSTRNVSPYNFTFYRSYFKECYKYIAKFNNIKLINNSVAGCSSYNKWLKLKGKKFKLVNNIYDFNKKIKINFIKIKKKNSINIGSIMRLDPEKNPFYFLELAKFIIAKNPNYYFYLMGDGVLKGAVKNFIKKHNLKKNIILIKNKNNIHDYLHFFDAFLLTSNFEGTPNVVLESQHVGTPIFFKKSGGTAEALIKNYTGYLLKNSSIYDNLKIIKNLTNKKKFFIKRDIIKIKKSLSKFLPENSVRKIINIYNEPTN
jgi:glycosyltransferase involved in cell wall biosynthesis